MKYDQESKDEGVIEKMKERNRVVHSLVDKMLIENEFENEDVNSLSHALRTNVKVNYDVKSLMTSESIYDVDPDLENLGLSDSEFLEKQRVRAETKFIKTKIIFKLYEGSLDLSVNEKRYLKYWM